MRSLSLQRQVACAVGLLLVPVLAAAAWSGMSSLRERTSELGDETRVVAYTTAAYVNRELTYLDGTGENLGANQSVQMLDGQVSEGLLRQITAGHKMITCIDLVRPSGDVVARAMVTRFEPESPSREWSEQVFRTNKRFLSSVYIAESGARYVVLGYPVRDQRQHVVGALGFFVGETGNGLPDGAPIQQGHVVIGQSPVDRFDPSATLDPSQVSR